MKAIVVTPKSQTEYKFISDLLRKLGVGSSTLSAEDIEDLGLLKLMTQADRSKKVSRDVVMKKLSA